MFDEWPWQAEDYLWQFCHLTLWAIPKFLVNAALRISGDGGDGNDGNEKHNSEINPLLINLISNLFF